MQPTDLENAPGEMWRLLATGAGAWRTPVVASVIPGGGADARTVVLRYVSAPQRELVFFTDLRSHKRAQLNADPGVCLVVYDEYRNLQVRLYGDAVHEQSPAKLDVWWKDLPVHQRRVYANDIAAHDRHPDKELGGRANFTAFRVVVERFHCLWIGDNVNEAAEFEWRGERWHGHQVLA